MFFKYIVSLSCICLMSTSLVAMEERENPQSSFVEIIDANKQPLSDIIQPGSTVCIFGVTPRFSQCQEYLWHAC